MLFITGMFRSGSTVLARMFGAHPEAASASDPMRPLFNSLRYDLAGERFQAMHDRHDPLGDYFLRQGDVLRRILEADLSQPLPESWKELDALYSMIIERAMPFSGEWARTLPRNPEPSTYAELAEHLLSHVRRVYGDGDVAATVFKEVWTTEMVPAVLRSFPEARALVVIRDPRAVTASNNSTPAKYPVLFLGRQWRKLAWLACVVRRMFPDRVKVLRYEDFVADPDARARELCAFAGIGFDERILDLRNYTDGDGGPWKQNTNYADGGRVSINTGSVDRWREVLEPRDLVLLELIGGELMRRFGYPTEYGPEHLLALEPDSVRRWTGDDLAGWIRPYVFDHDDARFSQALLMEKMRRQYLDSGRILPKNELFRLQAWQGEDNPCAT